MQRRRLAREVTRQFPALSPSLRPGAAPSNFHSLNRCAAILNSISLAHPEFLLRTGDYLLLHHDLDLLGGQDAVRFDGRYELEAQ